MITTLSAFLLTSFSIAELGDGFGMYVDMFLLAKGWGEKSVVISGIFRGVIDLLLKSFVGDVIDKTHHDRRSFLALAALVIGLSSLMVYFVDGADASDKILVYVVRSVESIALAFLGPAFTAITLSAFGPELFDTMSVKREIVSHIGSIFSAVLSGGIAWLFYPNIEAVFILPITFASSAVFFSRFLIRGDPAMGRGFHLQTEQRDEQNCVIDTHVGEEEPEASGYWEVFSDKRIMGLVAADVFHVIGEANVGLIFNSALAGVGSWSDNENDSNNNGDNIGADDDTDDGDTAIMARSAIPLLAAAGSLAQIVMVIGTWVVGYLTAQGWGRKPFYIAHLSIHPIRVLLILLCMWTNAGKGWLASTELIGGLTGALGIVNVFMRADIVFGSGRFNVVDGYMATVRGLAAVSSQYIGAVILEGQGPFVALSISFVIAVIPPIVGYLFVPETLGMRERDFKEEKMEENLLRAQARLGIEGESNYIEIGSFSSPSKVDSWVTTATTPDTVGSPGSPNSMEDIILTPDALVRRIV
jgi:hypothetical protein